MTSPLIWAYLISVGVLLMTAAHAAILAHGSDHARNSTAFALACLGFAGYQLCCALQYSAPDEASALAIHRWFNLFSIAIVPLMAFAARSFDRRQRSPQWFGGLLAMAVLLVADNFTSPYGYRFHTLDPDQLLTLPWGEQIRLVRGQPGIVYRAMRLVSLCVLVYALNVALSRIRTRDRLSGFVIWLGLGTMLLTLLLSSMSDSGVFALPYLGGFGFVVLAASFSLVVKREMVAHERLEKRITRALAKESLNRRRADALTEQILHQDLLTGLPNRNAFLASLERLIAQNGSEGTRLVVMLFDIDHLGAVKGTHGLAISDALLLQASRRLRSRIRDNDLLARSPGDGFSLVGNLIRTDAGVSVFCDKIRQSLTETMQVGELHFRLNASAGVAVFPDDALTAAELLAAAELALHDAKRAGSGLLRHFHPAMKESLRQRIGLESALREALDRQEFFLCYQPQVCADSGRTVGMEALLRWRHPEYGLIPPVHFIPLAEAGGQIGRIGAWVIDQACAQLAAWRQAGHAQLYVAVNISPVQLIDPGLEHVLLKAVAAHGIQPGELELEITESVLIEDPDRMVERFLALRELGFRLSIDDFGSGYSSLSYLRVLPVQAFKLDRSFVDGLCQDATSFEICASTIALARKLKLDVVAEGVETEEQAHRLRELGCPVFQGYLYSAPLEAEAAGLYLAQASGPALDAPIPPGLGPAGALR
ncbi:putative bifunctional diguanylate cyclase/phosphodiesterase [Uliginosibacterium paludis]|uniref:Bifunctional diguanylate cyclase/phosphodiesterase n=1 Tax=Uliginosibacterium paludis TaxID=1615952 RepID=A0ABV2CP22_9RHOO